MSTALRQRKAAIGKRQDAVLQSDRKVTGVAPSRREANSNGNERIQQHTVKNASQSSSSSSSRRSSWTIPLLGGALFVTVVTIWIVTNQDTIFNKYLPYVYLQHPEVVNQYLPNKNWHLRPFLDAQDLRQVLIVGTMSSGTRQVVSDLQQRLNLEVSHEASDASHYLVRDGTVSWFHGIRFFDIDSKNKKPNEESIKTFCQYPTPQVGFHPRFYDYSVCDASKQWSPCWASACERILQQEWGCARRNPNNCSTFQPFHTTLHQVRNPLHTVESLIAKFCGGNTSSDAWRRSGFPKVYRFLFPDDADNTTKDPSPAARPTCWDTVSQYVIKYSRAMLKAQQDGLIHATYSIETTSVCKVAELAGFSSPETVVYQPNLNKIQTRCQNTTTNKNNNHEPMTPKTKFLVNKGQIQIKSWSDLLVGERHGSSLEDRSLIEDIQSLMVDLGYDPTEIPEKRE
jgi:hypothetical protein